jgi:pimeloyl-ACP methyl ester carboxylesterase
VVQVHVGPQWLTRARSATSNPSPLSVPVSTTLSARGVNPRMPVIGPCLEGRMRGWAVAGQRRRLRAIPDCSRNGGLPRPRLWLRGVGRLAGTRPGISPASGLSQSILQPGREVLEDWVPGMFGSEPSPEVVDESLAIMSEFHPGAMAQLARSFALTDLRTTLPTIGVPTLVIHGSSDARSPLSVGYALHEAIPDSEMEVLEGVGHLSNLEAPAAFNRAVLRFSESRS